MSRAAAMALAVTVPTATPPITRPALLPLVNVSYFYLAVQGITNYLIDHFHALVLQLREQHRHARGF